MKTTIISLSFVVAILTIAPAYAATPNLIWSKTYSSSAFRESSPMPINYNGGSDEIIVGSRNKNVYVLDAANGNNVTNWPQMLSNPIDSTPSSADINGDGQLDIVIGSGVSDVGQCSGGGVYRLSTTGAVVFNAILSDNTGPGGTQCSNPAVHSSGALGDTNGDGGADITIGALGLKFWSLNHDGGLNRGWSYYWDDTQFASPALADVNSDGQTDIVMGGDSSSGPPVDHRGGMVRALKGDGSVLWTYFTNEIVRSSPSVGDVNGDGQLDVVFGTGNYWANNGGASDATKIFVVKASDGSLQWSKDLGAQTMASPTLADLNGDTQLDIVIGTWEGGSAGQVWALDGDSGANLPGYPRASGGGIVLGQITTADMNNDGRQDILVPTGGAVFAYDGNNGTQLFGLRQGFASYQNSPLVRDLDSNGQLDIILVGTKPDGTGVIDRFEFPNGDPAALGTNGWHMFRKDQRLTGSWSNPPLTQPPSGTAGQGYRMTTTEGDVATFGSAPFKGSLSSVNLNLPIVSTISKSSGNGYWLVASDGGIFSFGDAAFYGSTGAITLNKPIVGASATPSGNGYWLVASDGGIFSFGDAVFYGSTGAMTLNKPIIGMRATASGNGYWLVASDGGIFSFGDAAFYGSTGAINLNKPIVGIERTPGGNGYWLVASDGGIFSFGDAAFYGSTGAMTLNKPIIGMSRSAQGGYWLVASDGGMFSFNANFHGSWASTQLTSSVVSMASQSYY